MTPLIDGDILVYEASYASQYKDEESGETRAKPFEDAAEIFDERIKQVCSEVWATEEPILFLTGNRTLLPIYNRMRKTNGKEPIQYVPNFREQVAISRPYKERESTKPHHYKNLQAYCLANYEVVVGWGLEADDLLSVRQSSRLAFLDTIICSRDKDLRQVPGMQYSWEVGNQPGWGPVRVDEIGDLELITKERVKDGKTTYTHKLKGTGLKFFFSQVVTGDPVDTIPGIPGAGPKVAYEILSECTTEQEMFDNVAYLCREKVGKGWKKYLKEQIDLLWMVRELDEEGQPVLYVPPHLRERKE